MKVPVVSTSHQEAINSMFSSFARNCIGKTKNNMQLKDEFLTLKDYAFVVGEDAPAISLLEVNK